MPSSFPRILLLTRWAPDARYGGSEVLRKTLGRLPRERVRWAYLSKPYSGSPRPDLPESRAFPPPSLHWRLEHASLGFLYRGPLTAAGTAREIAGWVEGFTPELIWVLPELEAVDVALALHRRLGLPLHATWYDAAETARTAVPALYLPFLMRSVRRLSGRLRSADAISAELLEHARTCYGPLPADRGVVMPSSVPSDWMRGDPAARDWGRAGARRRIGLCGAMRMTGGEWNRFVALLGSLPFETDVEAFVYRDTFPDESLPPNVRVQHHEFLAERELIRILAGMNLDACYLGLWREKDHSLFVRTSLSSKLTVYAAAGVPVIVDAPEESVAWRLVRRYEAGVLLEEGGSSATDPRGREPDDVSGSRDPCRGNKSLSQNRERLMRLFTDERAWRQMAEGTARMCREEFDLERNAERLKRMMGGGVEKVEG